jgi:hypothetical protein
MNRVEGLVSALFMLVMHFLGGGSLPASLLRDERMRISKIKGSSIWNYSDDMQMQLL